LIATAVAVESGHPDGSSAQPQKSTIAAKKSAIAAKRLSLQDAAQKFT
jgi:hypothetical protein